MVICVTTLFALLKFQHLLMRKNPSVSENVESGAFDHTDPYNIADNEFMMAVSFEKWDKTGA